MHLLWHRYQPFLINYAFTIISIYSIFFVWKVFICVVRHPPRRSQAGIDRVYLIAVFTLHFHWHFADTYLIFIHIWKMPNSDLKTSDYMRGVFLRCHDTFLICGKFCINIWINMQVFIYFYWKKKEKRNQNYKLRTSCHLWSWRHLAFIAEPSCQSSFGFELYRFMVKNDRWENLSDPLWHPVIELRSLD